MQIKREVLYLAVTDDEFELPMCVCDTLVELSKWAGKDRTTIRRALHLGVSDNRNRCKYIKVEITNLQPTRVIVHIAIKMKKLNNIIINPTKK